MALGTNVKKKLISTENSPIEKPDKVNDKPEAAKGENSSIKALKEQERTLKFNQYCVFHAGHEEYAIPIDIVREVVKYSEPSPIPQMPKHIIGMSNVRGNIYGVMDLEMFFQGESREKKHKYLLVLDHEIFKMSIRIEDVPNSLMVSDDMIEELNSATLKSVIGQKYLKGIIKKDRRMIVLFDILGMISSDNFTKIEGQI